MNAKKVSDAVGAFFSGAGMFLATALVLGIAMSRFRFPHYGPAGYFWQQLIESLVICTIGAAVAAFFASNRFGGLGFTWGAIFGLFGSLVVGMQTFFDAQVNFPAGTKLLGAVPLAAAIAAGLWSEKIFSESPEEAGDESKLGEAMATRLAALESQFKELEGLPESLRRLEERVERLSQRPAVTQVQPQPKPVETAPQPPAAARSAPLKAAPAKRTPPEPGFSWDDIFEGRLLFRVGIAIFLLGVSFFLKFAFENQWIGPIGRVIMGFIAGISFIAFGDSQQRKGSALYGQTLIGGGLGILYLSIFAAFHYYGFLDQLPAFCAMALITVTAAVLAIRYSSQSIIIVAMAGGFATPALLSTGIVREAPLFSYLALLDIGVLGVSTFRNWRGLNLLAFALSEIWLQAYFVSDYRPEMQALMFAFSTLFFILFLIPNWGFNIRKKVSSVPTDLILMLGNAALFYGTAYYFLMEHTPWESWEAYLAVAVGLVYFAMAWTTFDLGIDDKLLLLCEMGLASAFAVIAIPIAWKWQWITIGWAVEALILLWTGFRLNYSAVRWAGRGLLLAAGFRALVFDQDLRAAYEPLLNTRSLSFLTVLAVMACGIWLIESHDKELTSEEKAVSSVLPVAWNLLCLYWLCAETGDYLKNIYIPLHPLASLTHYTTVAYSVIWTLYASALTAAGLMLQRKGLRIGAQLLFGATALKVTLVDLAELPLGSRVISFLVLGGLILFVSYFLQRTRRVEEAL